MLGFLLAGENLPFVAALTLMLLVGIAELLGLGGSLVPDVDGDSDASLLQWLNLGRLPLLLLLVAFLCTFGLAGLTLQRVVAAILGHPAPWFLATPAAMAIAVPATRATSRWVARLLPTEETSAVQLDTLVGRIAVIVTGEATSGSPAQARTRDVHGQPHYVMVEPDTAEETFAQGETVILVRRAGATFHAIRGVAGVRDANV